MSPDRVSGLAYFAVRVLFSLGLASVLLIVGVGAMEAGGPQVRIAAAFFASPLIAYALVHLLGISVGLAARRLSRVGGTVVIEQGARASVRFAWTWPLLAGWSIASLASIGLAVGFAILVAVGSVELGVGALCFAILFPIATGGAIALVVWRHIRSGARDLIVDSAAGVLRIPRGRGRSEQTLAFADTYGIEVGPYTDPTAPGAEERMTDNRLAVIIFTDQWKSPARVRRLGVWSDRVPAEEFAAWLRERVSLSPGEAAREA